VQQPQSAAAPAFETTSPAPRRTTTRRGNASEGESGAMAAMGMVKIVLGALGGLSMALLIVWIGFKADPLGLFQTEGGKGVAKKTPKTVVKVIERPSVRPANTQGSVDPANTTGGTGNSNPGATSDNSNPMPMETEPNEPTPAPMPEDPLPQPEEPVKPATPKRVPPPSSEAQNAKLAELKEAFKPEFEASTRPGTRETFPDFLLSTADKLDTDPVARFVLYREAFSRLIGQRDFGRAAELVDRFDREFEMDPFTLRMHTLSKASDAAKLPSEKLGIVLCAEELAELAQARRRSADAISLVRMADGHAKSLADVQLKNRILAMRVEIEDAADQWGPVERARQTLAENPDEPAAAAIDGRFRCLLEGDWQNGLPLLAKSSDQTLGPAAKQDLAGPTAEITAMVLGDNWFTLGESDPKLVACKARAAHWYRQAVDSAVSLDKVRLTTRIRAIEELNLPSRTADATTDIATVPLPPFAAMFSRVVTFEPVNLFKFVQQAELLKSPWNYDRGSTAQDPAIYSDPRAAFGRVPSHFNAAPREYQMSLNVARDYRSSVTNRDAVTGPLVIGLVGPRTQFAVVLDHPQGGQFVSMIAFKDAKTENDNPTVQKHSSPLIQLGSSPSSGSLVICQVRRESVSVTVDGQQACRFEGDLSKLVLPRDWSVNDNRAFIVGANNAAYFVSRWRLDPLPREAEPPAGGFDNPGFPNPGLGAPGLGVPPDAKFPAGLTPPGTPLPRGPGGGLAPDAE
jgi:hypothetical protein